MTQRTILILGAGGMLGHKLTHVLAGADELTVVAASRRPVSAPFQSDRATYVDGIAIAPGNVALRGLLSQVRADIIVNAVGAVKQRDLSRHVEETFYINGTLPHLLGIWAPSSKVIHISTDCVFTGQHGGYLETEAPDSTDIYGRSKTCGELTYGRHLTVRTSIIGFEVSSFYGLLSWFLRQPVDTPVPGYSRAIFSGLPTVTLSRHILEIIRNRQDLSGLYHVASQPIDKCTLLQRINMAMHLGYTIQSDEHVCIDRSLNDTRFRQATGIPRPRWDTLVEELAADYRSLPYESVLNHPHSQGE